MREAYLRIIESHDWVRMFTDAARMLAEASQFGVGVEPAGGKKITIAVRNRAYEFSQPVFLIGRKAGNDIQIEEEPNLSRLQALVFLVPSENIFLVVDIGSMTGFTTLSRSGSGPLVESRPGSRMVAIFEWGETVIMDMVGIIFAFNPKDCLVCFESVRSITFDCGHHVVCERCSVSLEKCPICRCSIGSRHSQYAAATMVAVPVALLKRAAATSTPPRPSRHG